MNSQASGSSTYRSLAQQQAVVTRLLDTQLLPRFAQECSASGQVAVRLAFRRDDQGRVHVVGTVQGDTELGCHRCDQTVPRKIQANFEALLAFDEDQAATWASQQADPEIVVVSSANLDVVELVEDELLLALPDRVCLDDDCPNMPAMFYGGDGLENCGVETIQEDVDDNRRLPFAGLKQALQNGEDDAS